MKADQMPFTAIVERRLADLQENPFAAATRTGLSYDKLRSVLRRDDRRSEPKLSTAQEICAALGLEFYIGPPRDTGPVVTTEIDGADFAAVPRYDVALAAGNGVLNDETPPVGAIAFRRDWLSREGIQPGEAMVVGVKGDSMAPTLCDGDLVLVDRRRKTPINRRIYALIGPDGEARIKRVERLSAGLLLQFDNDAYPSDLIPAVDAKRVEILGEVVWWGHTVRE